MSVRPTTPAQVAEALWQLAEVLASADNAYADCGDLYVDIGIQPVPGNAEAVDTLNIALFGVPGIDKPMSGGTWHHTTPDGVRQPAPPVRVAVYTSGQDPAVAAAKAERDRLAAELQELRALRDTELDARAER